MEPAAPGTEDEVPAPQQISFNKKASEQERLLSLTAPLPSGRTGKVFELTYFNGSEHWYCNVCECPVMGHVYHHEIGKRHTSNIAGKVPVYVEAAIKVAPGEPVPPGFENDEGDVERVPEIQERLDNYRIGPIIGLEYLLEMQKYDQTKEPSYLCLLCDKRGDPRTVIAHLSSNNHITQYIQRHFLKAFRALSPYITKQYKRNWQMTIQKIGEAIENKYGRLKLHVIEYETFEEKRALYQNKISKGPHFSENDGPTFEELVVPSQLTQLITDDMLNIDGDGKGGSSGEEGRRKSRRAGAVRRSLSSVSSISSNDMDAFDARKGPAARARRPHESKTMARSPPRRRSHSRSPYRRYVRRSRSRSPRRNPIYRNKERSTSRRRDLRRSNSRDRYLPWKRPDYVQNRDQISKTKKFAPAKKTDKLEEFKKLANAIENDMGEILKQHEKNPEKHPQYSEEWKLFWNKRYKALQTEGKDPNLHDFKPEWIEFWNKRMLEIHNSDLKTKKAALRKRLGLPDEPAPISFKIVAKKAKEKVAVPPVAAQPTQVTEVIVIDDKEDDEYKAPDTPPESERSSLRRGRRDSRDRKSSHSRSYERNRERIKARDKRASRERSRERRPRSLSSSSLESLDLEPKWKKEKEVRRSDSSYYRDPYRNSALPSYIQPPRVMRDVTRHPVLSPPLMRAMPVAPPPPLDVEDDGDVNVVQVLRLLTALEEKLGSLGPKVIDLLGQALALEKHEANSAETLLDNEINCVLFETIKEKLKGQLQAGLVDYAQERAFKIAIKKIAGLVHLVAERRREKQRAKAQDPVKVVGIGSVDKVAIAKQIAAALVLQGKTDITEAELEQLTNAVVGIAEASRNSNKPVTTASFLDQLAQQRKPEIESAFQSALLAPAAAVTEASTSSMEGLSDSDLQTLLQNFKDLCTNEQHSLIAYLKKLEATEPDRVERLRKFVNLDEKERDEPPTSPFSARLASGNPVKEDKGEITFTDDDNTSSVEPEKAPTKIHIDSDEEEEYSIEDVFKAATKNVKEKEMAQKMEKERLALELKDEIDLTNAKALIATLMGQIGAKNSMSNAEVGASPVSVSQATAPPATATTIAPFSYPFNPTMGTSTATVTNATSFVKTGDLLQLPPQQQQFDFHNAPQMKHSDFGIRPLSESDKAAMDYPMGGDAVGFRHAHAHTAHSNDFNIDRRADRGGFPMPEMNVGGAHPGPAPAPQQFVAYPLMGNQPRGPPPRGAPFNGGEAGRFAAPGHAPFHFERPRFQNNFGNRW